MIELKILPKYFNDIIYGNKRFELRKNDRNFKVGDIVLLNEYDVKNTGRYCYIIITYILDNCPEYGLDKEYCIFGFALL